MREAGFERGAGFEAEVGGGETAVTDPMGAAGLDDFLARDDAGPPDEAGPDFTGVAGGEGERDWHREGTHAAGHDAGGSIAELGPRGGLGVRHEVGMTLRGGMRGGGEQAVN